LSGLPADSAHERLRVEREERRRLAELIHDGPVQHVAALTQMLDAAAQALEADDPGAARTIVGRALEVARDAAVDLRDLVNGIEPPILAEQGFAAAVRELADRLAARHHIEFDLRLEALVALGDGASSGLYQIVRESLDQAVHRGPPSRVSVTLSATPPGGAVVVIADDATPERRQAVLDGLLERAAELNGSLDAGHEEGQTTIRVSLPPSATAL
jgi:signal transduction histidine kinase